MPHQDLIPFQWGAPGTFIGILSGKGQNAGVSSITDCKSDSDAIGSWIVAKGSKSEHTSSLYRREAERLALWSTFVRRKPLTGLTREDMLAYPRFISNPPPEWIMNKRYPRNSSEWRPFFLKGLSERSAHQSITVIHGLFQYLVKLGWIKQNPMPDSKATVSQLPPTIRSLSPEHMECVYEGLRRAEANANTQKEKILAARDTLLVTLLSLAPRTSENISTYGDIFTTPSKEGSMWVWRIHGKGGKLRLIPIPEWCLYELRYFRTLLGLSALWNPRDPSRSNSTHSKPDEIQFRDSSATTQKPDKKPGSIINI